MSKIKLFSSIQDVYRALDEGESIHKKFGWSHPTKTKNKQITLSLGRIWLNLLLPDNFELYDEPINQSKLDQIVRKISHVCEPKEASELLTKINQEAYKLGTYCPSTFNIDSLILPDNVKEEKKELTETGKNLSIDEFTNFRNKIIDDIDQYEKDNKFRINNILEGKIKFDKSAWGSLEVAHGYVADIEGNIKGPITHALSDGYNPTEFYEAAAEARRGFYYSAKRFVMKSNNIKLILQ